MGYFVSSGFLPSSMGNWWRTLLEVFSPKCWKAASTMSGATCSKFFELLLFVVSPRQSLTTGPGSGRLRDRFAPAAGLER